jgi:acyl-CoA thioesterase I
MRFCCTKKASQEPPRRAKSLCADAYRAFRAAIQALFALMSTIAFLSSGAAAARAEPLRLVAFGDSLTAGYLLPAEAAFPAQLERRLRADGFDVKVANAGVSGDTTTGGLARLNFSLGDKADLVILELGANDMLRGVDPKITRGNLERIVAQIEARRAAVLLAGMRASNNYGPDYKAEFDAIFPDLARARGLPLYPFFLEGVAGDRALSMPDGLHPTAEGVARIVEGIAPLVERSLARIAGASPSGPGR